MLHPRAGHGVSWARRDSFRSPDLSAPHSESSMHGEALIEASPRRVYSHLVDVARWPDWIPEVRRAQVPNEIRLGTAFEIEMCGVQLEAVVAEYEPDSRFGWVGSSPELSIYQSWTLVPVCPGTQVIAKKVERELTTAPMRDSQAEDLYYAHQDTLLRLKRLAEDAGPSA
ncbi:SRPBCC family protein [Micromonospora azadirachtae]|uniref:SRPBCC family protein n=1 Tax=Micromonospora azadirachtae TaxID=1970735 RepID=A0ABW3A1V7_9ACTN